MQAGQRLDRDRLGPRHVDHLRAHASRRRRDRDQHLVGSLVAEDRRQVVDRAEDPHAVHAKIPRLRVVVDDADRRVPQRRLPQHLPDDQVAGVTGADDDDLLAVGDDVPRRRAFDQRPREHPRSRDEREQEQEVHDRDRPRQADLRHEVREVEDETRDHARDRHAAGGSPHVPRGHVAPPAVVEAEAHERDELDPDHDRDGALEQRVVVGRDAVVEAELEGEVPRRGDQHRVERHLPQPVLRDREAHATFTLSASRTASTTCSCVSASMPAQIGTEKLSRASCSVTGSESSP